MKKNFIVISMTIFFEMLLFAGTSPAQFYGTHLYAIQVEDEDKGYISLTFNPDGTIIGQARLISEEKPLPLIGVWRNTLFVYKYRLSNDTEILNHCRFISGFEFIGFERHKKNGVPEKKISKVFGSKRDNV